MEEWIDEDDPLPETRGHETTANWKSSSNSGAPTNPPEPRPLITNYERADKQMKEQKELESRSLSSLSSNSPRDRFS